MRIDSLPGMKNILLAALCLFTFSAHAGTLETFFTSLEGQWEKITADSYRETPAGEFNHSTGTHFTANVKRDGQTWRFSEEVCWAEDGQDEACGESFVTYEIQGEELFAIFDGEKYPVDVLELEEGYIMMNLVTQDFAFMAVLTVDESGLSQESVFEMPDGVKEYQFLKLGKQ